MSTLKKSSTFTSREFNQDTARAKREAANGPVFITDRGQPSLVLLSIREYEKLAKPEPSIMKLFADPEAADIDLPLQKRTIGPIREIDFG
jgi:prevent-host-death family protein